MPKLTVDEVRLRFPDGQALQGRDGPICTFANSALLGPAALLSSGVSSLEFRKRPQRSTQHGVALPVARHPGLRKARGVMREMMPGSWPAQNWVASLGKRKPTSRAARGPCCHAGSRLWVQPILDRIGRTRSLLQLALSSDEQGVALELAPHLVLDRAEARRECLGSTRVASIELLPFTLVRQLAGAFFGLRQSSLQEQRLKACWSPKARLAAYSVLTRLMNLGSQSSRSIFSKFARMLSISCMAWQSTIP